MSLAPELAAIFREEARRALGTDVSAATVGRDLQVVLSGMELPEARAFISRLQDAAADYLVATHPAPPAPRGEADIPREAPEDDLEDDLEGYGETDDPETPDPGPAAPSAPVPETETAPADAVADTSPAEEPSADAA